MKKILSLLTFGFISAATFAQAVDVFQATIKKVPGQDNVLKFVIRPLINYTGQFSSCQFAISVPASIVPAPNAIVISRVVGLTYVLANAVATTQTASGSNFRNWTFIGDGVGAGPTVNYMAGIEYEIADIVFSDGPFDASSTVRLSSYPDGGTDGQSYFYMALNGTQTVNRPNQYYGPGSVNGIFETGFSFVPLSEVVLPVEFKSFYAVKSGDDARLSWDVSADEKNSHFEVLRSTDGRNFQNVQRVNALQNGRSDNSYQTSDLSLSKLGSREIFYQINQTDRDGTQTKSAVRKLSVDGLGKSVTAFPNPARTTTKLVVDAPENGKGAIIMRDALGRQIQNINAQFNKGINHFELKLMNIASGDYNISVMGGGINETIKVTKIN